MSGSANILSIDIFDSIKSALYQFRNNAIESMDSANLEIRQTTEWLDERKKYWLIQVERNRKLVNEANAALIRCQSSGYYDKNGNYHAPDCSAFRFALNRAQANLRQTEVELNNVYKWQRVLHQEIDEYQVQAHKLSRLFTDLFPKAIVNIPFLVPDQSRKIRFV